jgi:pilus assembly protein CpaE
VNQVAVLSSDDVLVEMVRATGIKTTRIDAIDFAKYSRSGDAPAAVMIDVRDDQQFPIGLTEFSRQHPKTGVIVVMASLEPRLMLEAMRVGVKECLANPLTQDGIDDAVRRLLSDVAPEPKGQIFAFIGAKGGVGTSTLAANTATALARYAPEETLLVDLHLVHGDAALFLGAEPRFSVIDALENVHRVDESFFSGLVEKNKLGVHLLASSTRPLHASMDPGRARALLEFASRKYKYTVLDVARSDFSMLDALDPATAIIIVTNQEVSALRSAAHVAETMRQRYGAHRIHVVINRFDKSSVVGTEDIARVVGEPVKYLIPSDYRLAVEAVNTGRPIVMHKEEKLARSLRLFAKELAGITTTNTTQQGPMLARLAWRRA